MDYPRGEANNIGGGSAGQHWTQSYPDGMRLRSTSHQRVTPGSGRPDTSDRPPADALLVSIDFDPPRVTMVSEVASAFAALPAAVCYDLLTVADNENTCDHRSNGSVSVPVDREIYASRPMDPFLIESRAPARRPEAIRSAGPGIPQFRSLWDDSSSPVVREP